IIFHNTIPRKNKTATAVLTSGQILKNTTDVLPPVSPVNPAITISIKADAVKTVADTRFCDSLKAVTSNTSRPMKTNVIPSAIHSIVMIRLLSTDNGSKPLTICLVGTI
ncbi:MAG: hypothetical protein L6N94_03865, partial [Candidatus Methylarchaceae archaeon HK01M]|nr:hypothetical protein [Candidatus Methylarchaceae archaeon HK01M]